MRVRNTSGISTEIVREVIEFVRPAGIYNFDVMVKNSANLFGGMSYRKGSSYHMTANPFVTVRIGAEKRFPSLPNKYRRPGGYLPIPWLASRIEVLVYILAHELRHQWQGKVKKGYRVWGARGQYSERDADAYALRMLRQWRKIIPNKETLS